MKHWKGSLVLLLIAVSAAVAVLNRSGQEEQGQAVDAAETAPRARAGGIAVAVSTRPIAPRVGRNELLVTVTGADGEPLENASVTAFAEMPAMGAMPAMRAPAELREFAPGQHRGDVELSMRGEWPLTVEVETVDGERQRLAFDLATDRAGVSPAGAAEVHTNANAGQAARHMGSITLDARRRQLIGVRSEATENRELVREIRAAGRVVVDERRLSRVTVRFDGYIGELHADHVGARVERGQVLFTVYSPELLAAQREYLDTLQRRGDGSDGLLAAARERLSLWDMGQAEIDALEQRGEPRDYVPIHAPRTGVVVERHVSAGAAVKQGEPVLTLADLGAVWVEADVYEGDLDHMQVGMAAHVALPYLPDDPRIAEVAYVYPTLREATRTGRLRLELDNPGGTLKPGMYADVTLSASLGRVLSVPQEAVIFAGERRVVFLDLGDGVLQPTPIRTGRRAEGRVEVLEGLEVGDRVVTSGNFLLAAETRLKSGAEQW